ncbi:hypothetical protein ACTFIW_007413 [Dictyostelium discoideum]
MKTKIMNSIKDEKLDKIEETDKGLVAATNSQLQYIPQNKAQDDQMDIDEEDDINISMLKLKQDQIETKKKEKEKEKLEKDQQDDYKLDSLKLCEQFESELMKTREI